MDRWEMHQPQERRRLYRGFQPCDGLVYSCPPAKGHLGTPNDPVAEDRGVLSLLCWPSVSSYLVLQYIYLRKLSNALSACVCAAGRVYSNIALDYLGDATYAVSKTYIWALAELTCVLIVFCMPAIPKVFSNDSKTPWVTRVMGSLRSWTRLLSLVAGRRKTSSKKQSAWQSRQDQDSDQGQQVSLDEVKLMNEQAQLGSVTISRADLDPYQTYEGSGDIFKTTETHLEEQSLPDLATDPGISQRYHQDHNAAVWEQGLPARH